jgi:endonuclease/exonuclease/phosphatase (EEP) superfamily protein YafD
VWLFELLVAAPLAAGAISMLFADSFWFGDVLLFFLPWVAFAAFLLFSLAWIVRLELVAIACALLVFVSAAMIAERRAETPEPLLLAGTPFRVTTFNTLVGTVDRAALEAFLRTEMPDVVALQETFGEFRMQMAILTDLYPHQSGLADTSDIEILSRHPITSAEYIPTTPDESGDTNRILRAVLDIEGRAVIVYVVHANSPRFSRSSWAGRNEVLSALAERTRKDPLGTPIVVAGDLNTAPWSPHFEVLLDAGLVATDNRLIPLATRIVDREILPTGFGAPVDHILVSRNVGWTPSRLGPDLGSDHRPVTADLVLYGTPVAATISPPPPPAAPAAPAPTPAAPTPATPPTPAAPAPAATPPAPAAPVAPLGEGVRQ